MLEDEIARAPRGTVALGALVGSLILLPIGMVISGMVSAISTGGSLPPDLLFQPDPDSDRVAAIGAEFRIDESGAATYSIPLYATPGTAGVTPKLSLRYSSQAGIGPLGKGWSIGGLSAIARCRATREAGDFIENGQPVDGNPAPITFTDSDRFCLDGQRLLVHAGSDGACPTVSGMAVIGYRTEIQSFQRICGYTPSGSSTGPAFFTVEGKDGSTAWYGDRDNSSVANRDDAYLNSTAPDKSASALVWAQTRFQDSTGNYIDYIYTKGFQDSPGEQLISKVRYTGKTVLSGQIGSALAPYAEITFTYEYLPTTKAYVGGGASYLNHRLASITSSVDAEYNGLFKEVRHYAMTYGYGSANQVLASVQECSDSTKQICARATNFQWSQATGNPGGSNGFFETGEVSAHVYQGSLTKFMGMKFGDIDGDGRQDLVWLKETRSGDACSTEFVHVLYSRLDAVGQITFPVADYVMCSPGQLAWSTHSGDGSWFLYDYDGDGRDDWFSAGPSGAWVGFRATGNPAHPFATETNLLAELAQPIPNGGDLLREPQHADLNGDGLIDLVYLRAGTLYARMMERGGSYGYRWGNERAVMLSSAGGVSPLVAYGFYHKDNYQQLNDFNADSRSDLLINVDAECTNGGGGSGGGGGGGDGEPKEPQVATLTTTTSTTEGCVVPFLVEQITTTSVVVRRYGISNFGSPVSQEKMSFADTNGDGLTDVVFHGDSTGILGYHLNAGNGWAPGSDGGSGSLGFGSGGPNTQVVDVNGDGRADIVTPTLDGSRFRVWYGKGTGGFWGPVELVNATTDCGDRGCVSSRSYFFQDMDGDGNVEYVRIKWDDDGSSPVYFSRPSPANRYVPRDVIVKITNGLGAETNITYAPLTNNAVYRPGIATRNTIVWGRGSPVQDMLAPMYVVYAAASTSPQAGNPNAKATLYYRYAGARMQSGGRGFLGFESIDTVDPNESGGYVVTTTRYLQSFPFVGLPARTTKAAVINQIYNVPACLSGAVTDACFSPPGQGLPALGGSWFSDRIHIWQSETDAGTGFNPVVQLPQYPTTSGTEELLRDPYTGVQTGRVSTTLVTGPYGNTTSTRVDTYTGSESSPTSTVTTNSSYTNDSVRWRLGRMAATQVTHRRPGVPDVVRYTTFAYAMSGPATGLLTEERLQTNGSADQDLRKLYDYDEFGNRIHVRTCSAAAGAKCDAFPNFQPTDPNEVVRYVHTTYDSRGRFPIKTTEPFATAEADTSKVLSFDRFGGVQLALDLYNVRTYTASGALGRGYFAWKQSAPDQWGPGSGGPRSFTTYRWCSQVACPTGASFRQRIVATGAPTQWTWFDALGRPMLAASETFNIGVAGKDVSATCTEYTATGKLRRTSNPFFLPGTSIGDLSGLPANVCQSAPYWTSSDYDVLGRPLRSVAPNNSQVTTTYNGLTTVTTDQRNNPTTQVRNGLGEVVRTTDAAGLTLHHSFDAAGNVVEVRRDAGQGAIVNTFGYDALGRKIWQSDPDSGWTRYQYNALGEVVAQEDGVGNRIEQAIDPRGRIWRKTVRQADGTIESQTDTVFDRGPSSALGQPSKETIAGTYLGWTGETGTGLSFSREFYYDTMGRPLGSTTLVDGAPYYAAVEYDSLGRPFRTQDVSLRWSKTEYNSRGMATALCESGAMDTYADCPSALQRTVETDAFGNPIREVRSPAGQIPVTRNYNGQTGRIESICAGNGCSLMAEGYAWDDAGNLHSHQKEGRYLETFTYDSLNRLKEGRLLTGEVLQSFDYDALGNICRKNGIAYGYGGNDGCPVTGMSMVPAAMVSEPTPFRSPLNANGNRRLDLKRGWWNRGHDLAPEYRPLRYRDVASQPFVNRSAKVRQRGGAGALLARKRGVAVAASADAGVTSTPAELLLSPHAVTQTGSGTSATFYSYDARGNQVGKDAPGSSNDRTIRYSLDDRPYQVTSGAGQRVRFWYGPDGQRYKRQDGVGKLTLYLGNVEVVIEGGVTTFKRTLGVVQQTIVDGAVTEHYLFHDHLGSLVRITDAVGTVVKSLDYAGFGERRDAAQPTQAGTGTPITTRGFTGHEMLDGLGVIHMNGRLFDPELGRFLQVDPFIQAPGNAQSWNAYTYVFNNPLRYTDPTGMLGVEERQWLGAIIMIAAVIFAPQFSGQYAAAYAAMYYAAAGFASGAVATQTWKGGLIGAMTAVVTAGIGGAAQGANDFMRVGLMAFTGGVMGTLQGGEFGSSFLSAGLTAAFMPQLGYIDSRAGRSIVAALIGGTVSELTGGKFANGAAFAALQAVLSPVVVGTRIAADAGSEGIPACERRTAEVDAKLRGESKAVTSGLTSEILATPEMDQTALSTKDRMFGADGHTPPKEKFLGIVGDRALDSVPVCADGLTVRSVLPAGSSGTVHPHPPGLGGEFPGPADPGLLKVGPAYYWTDHGALRVIEARTVNGQITPTLRTISGGNSRINAAASGWNPGVSDEALIRMEKRAYP